MKKLALLSLGAVFLIHSRTDEAVKVEQLKIGNFALPTSQQPGPLFSFGQNVIDKGDLQIFAYADYLKDDQTHFTEVTPSLLYGITDTLSVFVGTPVAVDFQLDNRRSSGLENIFVQFEYAPYNNDTLTTSDQITILGTILFPTSSLSFNSATGLSSPGFFFGGTASHMATDWYYFVSSGYLATITHNDIKFGNELFYQGGIAKNIGNPWGWICTWMIELYGLYTKRDRNHGIIDPDSGGHLIFLGPSLWLSSKKFIAQAGFAIPIFQHLFGNQAKFRYFLALNVGWKFN